MYMLGELSKVFKACGFETVDEHLASDVDKILDWQVVLQNVNTDGVKQMYNTLGDVEFIYNQDKDYGSDGDILSNAPEQEDNFFVVPKVVAK